MPLYTVDRIVRETNEIFDDNSHIIYVNSQITNDSALGRLMSDFRCKNPDEMHYDVLSDIAKYAKEREDEKGMCQIIDNIVQRERKQDKIDTALRMIAKGKYSAEEIAEMTNLPLEEVEELIKKRSA